MDGFDPQQSAQMLKSLTGGLGIALLTTITGLAANILLGLQLMRIDRFADGLVAEILSRGEAHTMANHPDKVNE
jgi:biopolymer transport protein ExbB/TolQ